MFIKVPVYNASLESEDRVYNTDHLEEMKPHANVPVDPGTVSTPCCEVTFQSGTTAIILVSSAEMEARLQVVVGITNITGDAL